MSVLTAPNELQVAESPVYWFVRLESSRMLGDLAAAAAARRELMRLGVLVEHAPARAADRKAVAGAR